MHNCFSNVHVGRNEIEQARKAVSMPVGLLHSTELHVTAKTTRNIMPVETSLRHLEGVLQSPM